MADLSRFTQRRKTERPAKQTRWPVVPTKYGLRRPDLVGELFCPLLEDMEAHKMANLNRFAGAGNFMRKEDVPNPVVLTVASSSEHTFPEKPQPQLVLNWQQPNAKPLCLNATNVKILQQLFGVQDDAQLPGLTIEVYTDPTVSMHGQIVGGLRIRPPQQQAAAAPPSPPPQPAATPPQPAGGDWNP